MRTSRYVGSATDFDPESGQREPIVTPRGASLNGRNTCTLLRKPRLRAQAALAALADATTPTARAPRLLGWRGLMLWRWLALHVSAIRKGDSAPTPISVARRLRAPDSMFDRALSFASIGEPTRSP
eukprot:SAG11_NODE_1004_length_6210_cov_14.226150_6_plen_126_part_00